METPESVRLVELAGNLDYEALGKLFVGLRREGITRVVLDLQKVPFVGSPALGQLVFELQRMRKAGGDIRLCGVQTPVRTLLEMTALDQVFELFDDCDEAVASF